MSADYHCTVIGKATPFREFSERRMHVDNSSMDIEELAAIRRDNLRRFVDTKLEGNLSALARAYRPDNPRPSFFSDLFRKKKHFGEKLALELETRLGLKKDQLSIPGSPLEMREIRADRTADELKARVDDLTPSEREQVLNAIAEILSKRKTKKRA